MSIQLRDVTENYSRPEPGTLISGSRLNIISRTVVLNPPAGYAALDIAPGAPVFQSPTHDRHCSGQPGIGPFLGIAVLDMGTVNDPFVLGSGRPTYSPGAEISILTKGEILVVAASDVNAGDIAYVGPRAGIYSGALTTAAAGSVQIPAKWVETARSVAVARLQIF